MIDVDIVRWAESSIGFYVDRRWTEDGWQLGPGPIKLAAYHADLLRHIFTPDDAGRLPYDTVAWCEPAKSGKSAIAGLVAQFMALHGERNSAVVMASNKRDQAASVMFSSLSYSVEHNPALKTQPGRYSATFDNGCEVKAIPSNSKGEAGARFSLALFDELWGYVYQDAQRLWSEFKTDPTRLHSLKFSVGYAGYVGESELWQTLLETGLKGEAVPELSHITDADGSPTCWRNGRHFTFWSHTTRQPWQTDAWLETQRKALRENEYRRMILTQFVEGAGDFYPYESWLKLIDPELRPLAPTKAVPLYVGLDVATKPGGDDCALIAVYYDAGRVKVAWHKVWKGGKQRRKELKLGETVQPYILRQNERYNIMGLWFDPYQALTLADNLRKAGLWCVEVPQTHGSRGPHDTFLFEAASNGTLALYDDKQLKGMAASAGAKELGNGLLFIQKAGRGKIDLLVALSNCALPCWQRGRRGADGFWGVLHRETPEQQAEAAAVDWTSLDVKGARDKALKLQRQKQTEQDAKARERAERRERRRQEYDDRWHTGRHNFYTRR